ncbi:hypothetical protein RvY_02575-3 [Ramazzottius varieornatus]|uniref:Uncharacterized protein n=1 Tax=Ramazzottius varieornatus TaxID=947166 RepID=A0A1D1UK80_RAMVA|nr:hypothetical protein RvY_02575-3 [Ramazzottius varieornatus]
MMLRGLEPDSEALLWKMVSVGEYRDAIHSFLKLCSGAGEEWTPFEDDMDETRLMIVKKQIIVVGEGSAVETYDDVNSSPVDTVSKLDNWRLDKVGQIHLTSLFPLVAHVSRNVCWKSAPLRKRSCQVV